MATLSEEVQKALTDVAERLWAVSTIEDGYSILGAPRGLRSELENEVIRLKLPREPMEHIVSVTLFGSPPDSITSSVKSFPFLVDVFVAGFDAAGQECWEALLEKWEFWNEDYENPENPIPIPSGLLREAEAEDFREHGQPRGMVSGLSHQERVREIAQRMMTRDEVDEFLNEQRLPNRSPQEPEAKISHPGRSHLPRHAVGT